MTDTLSVPAEMPPAPPPPPLPVPVSEIRALVERDLAIESIEIPRDAEHEGVLVVRGRLMRPSHESFPRWLVAFNGLGYTPMLRAAEAGGPDQVTLRIFAGVARRGRSRVWINVVLFVLTVVSTLFAGSIYGDNQLVLRTPWDLLLPQNLIKGLPFAATLLGILTAHEFGHYFAARYHKVSVTLPYFIPMPFTFGTLGAFIQLKEPVPDRRRLFDIGVAGPLAGLLLAVPLLFYGLATSPMEVPVPGPGAMVEGNSIFYLAAKWLVFGKILPNPITGEDVIMNQVSFGAWIGLLVTALNLLPVGQLDGGHTVFALFGKRARIVNLTTVGIMLVFAVASLAPVQRILPALGSVAYGGWFIWIFLIFFVIGIEHPPALDDVTRVDTRRRWIGYLVILIFVLTFVPVPFRPL